MCISGRKNRGTTRIAHKAPLKAFNAGLRRIHHPELGDGARFSLYGFAFSQGKISLYCESRLIPSKHFKY